MRVRLWLAMLGALLLGACAHHPRFAQFTVPEPSRPQIVMSPNGRLIVNQEPIVIALKERERVTITYALPPGSGLTFDPVKGVRVIGRVKDENYRPIPLETKYNEQFSCAMPASATDKRVAAGGLQTFVCAMPAKGTVPLGQYAYEINVIGPQGPITLDPSWMPY